MLCLQSLSLYREEAGWMDSSEKTADFDLLISHFLPTVNVSFFFTMMMKVILTRWILYLNLAQS